MKEMRRLRDILRWRSARQARWPSRPARFGGLALLTILVLAARAPLPAGAEDPFTTVGTVDWVGKDAVEVAGHRGLVDPTTTVMSNGHPVAFSSVHAGMSAELETDDAGHALELRVTGVVE
jgi:hypothetical protein